MSIFSETCNGNGIVQNNGSCNCNAGHVGNQCQYLSITKENFRNKIKDGLIIILQQLVNMVL